MGRTPCCDKMGLKKGPWTPEEDEKLLAYIQEHGHGSWRSLPSKAGLQRCGKSCRLRWANYLRPDIKRGKFSLQEEETIIQLHALLGNRWSAIANHLPKRTDNEIKNYWNTHLKKKLTKMGIDPMTHKPKNLALGIGQSKEMANISHMAQWESARLEAEARLRSSNPFYSQSFNKAATAPPPPPPPPPPLPWPRPPCLDILKVWAWTNPGKNISTMILNGFAPSNLSLQSPTSILNNSENMLQITNNVGFFYGDSSITNGKPSNNYLQDNEIKGIMENSMELHYNTVNPMDSTYYADSLGFPSFMEGFNMDISPSAICATGPSNNLEESKNNCWSNVLNFPSSPMGLPML